MIDDVLISDLSVIDTSGGSVMHGIKKSSKGYVDFGEAYFSEIQCNSIKAWKRHKKMTLNIVVPIGKIRFVLFDDRDLKATQFQEVILSRENYCRLTVPPMVWLGFQGFSSKDSILLNLADIEHDPNEVDRVDFDKINYNWNQV